MKNKGKRRPFRGPKTLRSVFSGMEKKDSLDLLIAGTGMEWYEAKHPAASPQEVALLNSLRIDRCPFCGHGRFVRDGRRKNGVQRYRCPLCGRRFGPLTGTVFDSHKIPVSEWIEFLVHLFQYESMKDSAIDNTNAYSTGRYWTKKLFLVLRGCQDAIVVSGTFWTDETYLKATPGDLRRDGEGHLLRGLSRNNYCVLTATDGVRTVLVAEGMGKPSKARIRKGLAPHVAPGSHMVDDGEKTHSVLVDELGVTRTVYPSKATKGLPNERNPMEPVNAVHREFKKFMRRHGGYRREDLQDWCNLFSFIYNRRDDLAGFLRDILQMAVSTHEVLRYRDGMRKKPMNG